MLSTHRHHPPAGATPNTVLKWCRNGELSRLDLERIVERLQQLDPTAHTLHASQFTGAGDQA